MKLSLNILKNIHNNNNLHMPSEGQIYTKEYQYIYKKIKILCKYSNICSRKYEKWIYNFSAINDNIDNIDSYCNGYQLLPFEITYIDNRVECIGSITINDVPYDKFLDDANTKNFIIGLLNRAYKKIINTCNDDPGMLEYIIEDVQNQFLY